MILRGGMILLKQIHAGEKQQVLRLRSIAAQSLSAQDDKVKKGRHVFRPPAKTSVGKTTGRAQDDKVISGSEGFDSSSRR
jgi:hypothetical protein